MGYIDRKQLERLACTMANSDYGKYLLRVAAGPDPRLARRGSDDHGISDGTG
jgi:hypothetical protein